MFVGMTVGGGSGAPLFFFFFLMDSCWYGVWGRSNRSFKVCVNRKGVIKHSFLTKTVTCLT